MEKPRKRRKAIPTETGVRDGRESPKVRLMVPIKGQADPLGQASVAEQTRPLQSPRRHL